MSTTTEAPRISEEHREVLEQKEALETFFGQLDSQGMVVDGVAEALEEEGIHSYAGALRAARVNLREAFYRLIDDLPQPIDTEEVVS